MTETVNDARLIFLGQHHIAKYLFPAGQLSAKITKSPQTTTPINANLLTLPFFFLPVF